jgi:serine/threonine-protein kinase HipA
MKAGKAIVLNNGRLAGRLSKSKAGYAFVYSESYLLDAAAPPISLTLPKRAEEYRSDVLFPFFSGLLAEGENKRAQCRSLKIDERDQFTRLLKTAGTDTIGAITVREDDEIR